MDKQYYIQVVARNYLKNVVADPIPINVHAKFLNGLSKEEFEEGFCSLLALFRRLYGDIANNPADFGMTLKEAEDIDAKNTNYTNSNASFLRVPNLLYVLGVSSNLESDGALAVNNSILSANAKTLKITGMSILLGKLREYGFDIHDFGKSPKSGETLSIGFIDNRYLTTVLKAMADALWELTGGDLRNAKNDYFYMMHPALLENETVKEPKLTVDFIFNTLDPVQQNYAVTLHNSAESNTKQSIRLSQLMRNDWSCTYTHKKNKKVLMSLRVKQDQLYVKLNLQNIGRYIYMIAEMPAEIQDAIRNGGWECGGCNPRCSGGFAFEMDGNAYNKCHCGSFVFEELTAENLIYYEHLINKELAVITG